jgi:two-component system chemotaxis response regulator CheY
MQSVSMDGDMADLPLLLAPTLDVGAAKELLDAIRQRANGGAPLRVDASAVATLTLPCMQIMLAAARSHGQIAVKNPSNEFISAFEDLGIDWMQDFDCSEEQSEDSDRQATDIEDVQQLIADTGETQTESVAADLESNCEIPRSETAQQPSINEDEMRTEQPDPDLQQMSESAMSTRILTIDDSKTMRDMLMLTLAEAGFDVLQAVDGQDGLDVLVNERVDVVITDINMPRMDGYEVIRQLRRKPEHKSTPILVLTTESETEKKNLAREAGATGWLVKPFDPDRLVATVRKVAP